MMNCSCTRAADGNARCTKCGAALCTLCAAYAKAHGGAGPECQPGHPRPTIAADAPPLNPHNLSRSRGPQR
jgi:hypothetical protein